VALHTKTIASNSVYFDDPASMPTYAASQGLATISQADSLGCVPPSVISLLRAGQLF